MIYINDNIYSDIDGIVTFAESFSKAISEFSIQFMTLYKESLKAVFEQLVIIIQELVKQINSTVTSYKLTELTIPDLSVSFNNEDYLPQAPPFGKSKKSKWEKFISSGFINWVLSNIKELPNTIAQNAMYDLLKFSLFTAVTYYVTHCL